ncbi:MAG: purine-binding chemotaxis protein CheW [Mycobacteriales bacterium]
MTEILAERARALAVPLRVGEAAETVDLVVLRIGPEGYGLDTRFVVEVQPLAGLARVPGLPALWAGVANIRGTLWPVLDLGYYLGLPSGRESSGRESSGWESSGREASGRELSGRESTGREPSGREPSGLPGAGRARAGTSGPGRPGRKVALVADAGLTVGLLVDDAVEIRRVPVELIGPPLVGPASAARRQIRGVTPDLLTVLDVAGLLADPRLVVREEPT